VAKIDKKLRKEQIIAGVIILIVIILGISAYFVFGLGRKVNDEGSKNIPKPLDCSKITAENNIVEGKAPFAPTLTAKIGGNYDPSKPVCEWYIDNALAFKSYPVKGSCVFSRRAFAIHGQYEISYKVFGLSGCPQKIKVTVTK
jgi:hypothetical protein